MTGSSCPLRRRRPGRSESGVRIDREGWNGLETVTPVTLALTSRQGGTVLDRLLGQVRPARGNVNMCVHDRISLPASIQETQWSAADVVMRNSLSDLTFDALLFAGSNAPRLGTPHPGSPPGASCGRLSGL